MKPKGHLGSQKISNFVPKITGKSRDPELMYKQCIGEPPRNYGAYYAQHITACSPDSKSYLHICPSSYWTILVFHPYLKSSLVWDIFSMTSPKKTKDKTQTHFRQTILLDYTKENFIVTFCFSRLVFILLIF